MAQLIDYLTAGIIIALLIYSIILHEIAHAYSAFLLGDPTAAMQGRLTLNPLAHIDPIQTLLMPLITYRAFGLIFGGAKPVPINPLRFRDMSRGMMITGAAGPLTNVTIALAFALLHRVLLLGEGYVADRIYHIVFTVGLLNLWLTVFNLIPIPPLDGSRILRYFLPRRQQIAYDRLEQFGLLLVLVALMVFRDELNWVRYYVGKAYLHLAGSPY